MPIYTEAPWVVPVSVRSPERRTAKKHIDTFLPSQKARVLAYIAEKGYALGRSEFKTVAEGYKLADNERWMNRDAREVEIRAEHGVCNDHVLRDEMNVVYLIDLQKHLPEWPWAFERHNVIQQGFGL